MSIGSAGMNSVNSIFSEQILADKLSKLNSTQQCIETLSHWCIFHQSKAEVVVATWIKQFQSSELAQKVPLLYLANDILQNSKRKGNEFVTEFWKVLPKAVKDVADSGDDRGKNVASRLINIWEERRVFGSQTRNLKDVMLGGELPQPLELGKKRSRSVKIVKRDSRSIRTKLSVGSSAEKIVSAFHIVLSDHTGQDAEMNKCKSAISSVRKMEQDVDSAYGHAKDPKRRILADMLEEQENVMKQSVEKLKTYEVNRVLLVTQLKAALQDQESELEDVHTLIQVAQAQSEAVRDMRKRLLDETYTATPKQLSDRATSNGVQKSSKTAADIAAEVADKLTASSSSQMIMSSVLSTFAAEAAKNGVITTSSEPNSLPRPENQIPPPAPSTNPYQSHYHLPLPSANPPYQNYSQASVGGQNGYSYSAYQGIPPPLMHPPQQQQQQHMLPGHQQMMPLTQQQQQQPLPPPHSYHQFQPPPGMAYYSHPPQSQ